MQEQLQSIYNGLSIQRMDKYQSSGVEPLDLYKWNIALSESLYPLLHIIEVALRNRLHAEIVELLNNPEWLLGKEQKILERVGSQWLQKIEANIRLLKKKSKLDEGHLVAELNFGFWTTLLSGPFEYKQLLWPKLKNKVFPNAHGIPIDYIRERFDKIRSLRNRIFHYGSIWHNKDLSTQHDYIVEAIKWIDPTLLYMIQVDRFNEVYSRGPDGKK